LLKKKPNQDADGAIANAIRAAELAAEKKAEDIKAYDLRPLTVIADTFVICTANSAPQQKAILNNVRMGMKEAGVPPEHIEGAPGDGWFLVDFGTVVFHVFNAEARAFYDLEGMWADAEAIPLALDETE